MNKTITSFFLKLNKNKFTFLIFIAPILCFIQLINTRIDDRNAISHAPKKGIAIIFDLGGVLVKPQKGAIVHHMMKEDKANLLDLIFWGSKMRHNTYELLETLWGAQKEIPGKLVVRDDTGRPLPQIMADWLAGTMPCHASEVIAQVSHICTVASCSKKHADGTITWCSNKKLRGKHKMIASCATTIFSRSTNHFKLIDKNIALLKKLKECARAQKDMPVELYILSNWNDELFDAFLTTPVGQEILALIPRENMIISGYEKVNKPDPEIFKILLNRFNLSPSQCIFIDDQVENRKTADALGFLLSIDGSKPKQVKHLIRNQLAAYGITI